MPAGEIEQFVVEQIRELAGDRSLVQAILAEVRRPTEEGLGPLGARTDEKAGGERIDDRAAVAALARLGSVWPTLATGEQARLLGVLIERVEYDGHHGKVAVTFRPSGMEAVVDEILGKPEALT